VAWCQDITYIATKEGWLCLASALDLGSRRLLGYSMADHMRTELVLDALEYACHVRDAMIAPRERLLLPLAEDCPGFAPIHREQRASLAGTPERPRPRRRAGGCRTAFVAHTFDGID
jgi:hypothetical protein